MVSSKGEGEEKNIFPNACGRVELAAVWPDAIKRRSPVKAELFFVSPRTGDALFGLGCNWFARVSVNGEVALDIMTRG